MQLHTLRQLLGGCQVIAIWLIGSCQVVARFFQVIASWLLSECLVVSRWLVCGFKVVARELLGCSFIVNRQFIGDCYVFVMWFLSGCLVVTIWLLFIGSPSLLQSPKSHFAAAEPKISFWLQICPNFVNARRSLEFLGLSQAGIRPSGPPLSTAHLDQTFSPLSQG